MSQIIKSDRACNSNDPHPLADSGSSPIRAAARNGGPLTRAEFSGQQRCSFLRRLSDDALEQLIKEAQAERRHRQQCAGFFRDESNRGRAHRGLTRGDMLEVMRRREFPHEMRR
jgi:hypothetical protein